MAMELAAWLESGDARSSALMKRYVRWFRENGRGAGSLMSSVLALSVRGETQASRKVWDSCCRFDRPPQGNGALMRVAPVGFIGLEDPGKARELAQLDAALTHWDPICTEASAFLALLVSAHLREEPDARGWAKAAMESRLSAELSDAIEPRPLAGLEERGLDGWDMGHVLLTLQTAVSVLESGLGFEAGLLWTLRQGGDADTNGAVVGALLGGPGRRRGHSGRMDQPGRGGGQDRRDGPGVRGQGGQGFLTIRSARAPVPAVRASSPSARRARAPRRSGRTAGATGGRPVRGSP